MGLLQECRLLRWVYAGCRNGPETELSHPSEARFPLFQRLSTADTVGLASRRSYATAIPPPRRFRREPPGFQAFMANHP